MVRDIKLILVEAEFGLRKERMVIMPNWLVGINADDVVWAAAVLRGDLL